MKQLVAWSRGHVRWLALGLAALLGACTEHPAESVPMMPSPPSQSPPSPVSGAISIRLLPDGAVSLDEISEVVADATVSGGTGHLRLWVDFVEPGGTTYQRLGAEVDALPERAQQSVALSVPVNGTEATRFRGAWTAVLIGPEGPLAGASFALGEVAP
jgi:hypothetical protein